MSESSQRNFICLKWGTRYPAKYTNILYKSVQRHTTKPFRFVCVTDDPSGLDEGIDIQPIAPNPGYPEDEWPNIFLKLAIFQDGFANLSGPTLFLDVDVVIMDNIDCFFEYAPGENCIIHNWIEWHKTIFRARPNIGNSSVFRFEAGKSGYIYEDFLKRFEDANNRKLFPTEQAFLTDSMKKVNWWPEEWVVSFKRKCRPVFPLNLMIPPQEPKTRILVFHGNPDPDQAVAGFRGRKPHHYTLPAPWILEHWKK